ncbi:unnamed protein product [Calypogeia fissa]
MEIKRRQSGLETGGAARPRLETGDRPSSAGCNMEPDVGGWQLYLSLGPLAGGAGTRDRSTFLADGAAGMLPVLPLTCTHVVGPTDPPSYFSSGPPSFRSQPSVWRAVVTPGRPNQVDPPRALPISSLLPVALLVALSWFFLHGPAHGPSSCRVLPASCVLYAAIVAFPCSCVAITALQNLVQ